MGNTGNLPIRAYRSIQGIVPGIIIVLLYLLIGVTMVASPGLVGGASGVAVGGIVVAFSICVGGAIATNRIIVTSRELVIFYNFRRTVIPLSSITRCWPGRTAIAGFWLVLIIETPTEKTLARSVCGSRKFVKGVADQLNEYVHESKCYSRASE